VVSTDEYGAMQIFESASNDLRSAGAAFVDQQDIGKFGRGLLATEVE